MHYLRDAALAVGGVCLGVALAAMVHPGQEWVFVVAALAFFAVAGVLDWRGRLPKSLSTPALRRQSRELALQINEFVADRNRSAPTVPPGATDDERHAVVLPYMTETTDRYRTRFHGRALAIYRELLRRKLIMEGSEKIWFQGALVPTGIETIAAVLAEAGEDLTEP